jgi:glutamine amidotransferase-like uncharacterized protein
MTRPFPLLFLLASSCTPCEECEDCALEDTRAPCTEDSGPSCPADTGEDQPDDTAVDDTGDTTPPVLLVAIYDDTDSAYPGAWGDGLDAIEAAVTDAGHIARRVTRLELNTEPGLLQGYDALLFGGGYAYPGYTVHISDAGKARIQEYIHGGGAYLGICAGAYFACDSLRYEGVTIDDESGYDIDLYDQVCGGPVDEVSSYPDWAPATISFPGHQAYQAFDADPFERQLFYAGGPFFPTLPDDAEALAHYADPGDHQGMAAAVTFPYGQGRVVLWGPHPEVLSVEVGPDIELDAGNRELYATVLAWAAGAGG